MITRWSALFVSVCVVSASACGSKLDVSASADDAGASQRAGSGGSDELAPAAGEAGTASEHPNAGGGGAMHDGRAGQAGSGDAGLAGEAGGSEFEKGGDGNSGGSAGSAKGGSAGAAVGSNAGNGGSGGAVPTAAQLLGTNCVGCTATALGKPNWNLTGIVTGVVPTFGSKTDGSEPLRDWLAKLFGGKHPFFGNENLYGPGVAHAGPYNHEPASLFAAANVDAKQTFTTAEFSAPSGVALVVCVVPNASAPYGTSPDFTDGPIIPNGLFPLYVDGDLRLNGVAYDKAFDGVYTGYDQFSPPIAKQGASHVMLWFAENSSYGPKVDPQGTYDFQLSVVDASSVGWVVHVPFVVQ